MNEKSIAHYTLLDEIIQVLHDNLNGKYYENLYEIFVIQKNESDYHNRDDDFIKLASHEVDFMSALTYLESEKLIRSDVDDIGTEYYELTFMGRIKATETFVDEYRREQAEKEQNKILKGNQITLTEIQIKEIKRSKIRSWVAIGISVTALLTTIFVKVWEAYHQPNHNNNSNNCQNKKDTEPIIKDDFTFKVKDSADTIK